MIYLLLSVLCSLVISILLKGRRKFASNEIAMFLSNYAVCTMLSLYYSGTVSFEKDARFGLYLGIFSGFLYLYSFILSDYNVGKNGMVMTNVFGKLGVIVPTILSVVIFKEKMSTLHWFGFFIALVGIVVMYFEKGSTSSITSGGLLLFYLVTSGAVNFTSGIYDKIGSPAFKDQYLLFNFIFAFIYTLIFLVIKRKDFSWKEIVYGAVIGVPNYFSSRFFLYGLATVPQVIAYPVVSVGSILSITLSGVLLFHEKLSRNKIFALAIIVVSMILLNI